MRASAGPETAPEQTLRAALREQGLRGYRIHPRDVLGRPDLAYVGLKLAVFIDGCFWHGCPEHCRRPASNSAYWAQKIDRNAARDLTIAASLHGDGWTVVRVWEHEIKRDAPAAARHVASAVRTVREERASYHAQKVKTSKGAEVPF